MEDKDLERFFSYVEKTDSCWLWKSASNDGYGKFRLNGKSWNCHRLIYIHCYGDPGDLIICHKPGIGCKKNCVNPEHLRADTFRANLLDRNIDGTVPNHKGDTNPNSQLTKNEVLEIRASQLSLKEISNKYGITKVMVSNIRRRKAWTNI